jgi:ADP-ribosyl-[dinitrogen reductase] hydrolase
MEVADRAAGCLLGLALGDALGTPFDGRRAHEIPDPIPAFERTWRGLPPGSTTDATALARQLVASLVERNEFDPDDLVARHVAWLRSNPPRMDSLTRAVLARVTNSERAFDAARAEWDRRGPEISAGNGAVKYAGPLGAGLDGRPRSIAELASTLSALTHFDERSRTACVAVTTAVNALVHGDPPDMALAGALETVADRPGGEELEFLTEAAGTQRHVDGPDRRFCLFAAGLGLQALHRGGTFEAGLVRVVALGGSTGANAAVAGAILGARDGRSGLPHRWLGRLLDRESIEQEGEALGRLATTTSEP